MIAFPVDVRPAAGASAWRGAGAQVCAAGWIGWVRVFFLCLAAAAGCGDDIYPADARSEADLGGSGADGRASWDSGDRPDARRRDSSSELDAPPGDAGGNPDAAQDDDSGADALPPDDAAATDARDPRPTCGNGRCEHKETSSSCPSDCSASRPNCMAPKDPFLNPFNRLSAHHRPVGEGAVYATPDDPATVDWKKASGFNINVGAPWGVSLAETDERDPLRTIVGNPLKCDRVIGLPVSIRFPRDGFSTKVVMNSHGCTDGVVMIYDRVAQKPNQLRQYDWNGGNPKAGQYKTWDIRGLGHGSKPGDRVGTSASGVAAIFGLMRGHEVNTPGVKIQHVHQLVLPRTNAHCAMMLSRQIVWPAVSTDGSANQGGNNLGHIPYGGLLALLPRSKGGPNLDDLSEPGRRVAEALRDYGAIAVDGGGCVALRADQFVREDVRKQLMADLRKIYPFMRLVKNTAPEQRASGGGAALAPNCAFDAGDGD